MAADKFDIIANRIVLLTLKWEYWQQLYSNRDSVDQLNRCAPSVFCIFQEALLFDVVSSICRLLDNPKTGAKPNLVIETLVESIPNAQLQQERLNELNDLRRSASVLKELRHKVIAHEDEGTALGQTRLSASDSNDIEQALTNIHTLVGRIEREAGKPAHVYTSPPELNGSGNTLMWLLNASYTHLVEAKSNTTSNSVPVVPDIDHIPLLYVRYPH